MSLYSLASSLFADMDKARAVGGAGKGRRDEARVTARSERELLPRLTTCGGRDDDNSDTKQTTPTLELLEGCLHDVQKV